MKYCPCYLAVGIFYVTPCVGVWIEIASHSANSSAICVTPCVGVWIEIGTYQKNCWSKAVTPCVGVWIEIACFTLCADILSSLPVWECGLKSQR